MNRKPPFARTMASNSQNPRRHRFMTLPGPSRPPQLLLITLGLCLAACSAPEPESASGPRVAREVPVVAETVTLDTRRTRIEAVGTARALKSVAVFAEAAGEVVRVNFQPGDKVSAGDVLVARSV